MSIRPFCYLISFTLVSALATTTPLKAMDFASLSKDKRKALFTAYLEIDAIDQILPICEEIAPAYSAANQAAMAELKQARSIEQAQDLVEQYVAWQKVENAETEATLKLTLALTRKAIRAQFDEAPHKCEESFRAELFETEFTNLTAVVDAFGLDSAVEPAPSDVADADQTDESVDEPAVVATNATATTGMPTPIGDRVDELPGLSWNLDHGVRRANSGGALCIWRCVVLQHGDESFPWLIIHEALPLTAEEAIDQKHALMEKRTLIEQQDIEAGSFADRMAMGPDRLVVRNAYIEHYSDEDRYSIFALERGGLTVVAELFYPDGDRVPEASELALSAVVASIRMDEAAVIASLTEDPIAPSIESARGAPPSDHQVLYAETPNSSMNALTLSVSWDDDVRYLEKAVLESDGPVIDMNESTYYYVPPQPDGATIEGVFKSSDGYAGVGVSVLKTKTLVFNKNGRYTTSASSGVVGGFLSSTGSGSEGEGSYRINGYTLELRSDDGTTQSDIFFPYLSRTFWPGSDGPVDEVNFINLGGKVLYRDDE